MRACGELCGGYAPTPPFACGGPSLSRIRISKVKGPPQANGGVGAQPPQSSPQAQSQFCQTPNAGINLLFLWQAFYE